MKQEIRLGDSYALTKHKPKQYIIRYISLLAVLTSMCLYAVKQVSAQQAEPAATAVESIKPLQIGDTIPEWLWHYPMQVVNHPEGKDTITLDDYRDKKLIILEFGSTVCVPCIRSVEKLTAIEEDYSDSFKLLPISNQKVENIERFQERKKWHIAYVANDTVVQDFFPHDIIPHLVWISGGKVVAITDAASANRGTIAAVMKGYGAPVDRKVDRSYDRKKPLLIDGNAGDISDFRYHSLFTRRIPGLIGGITTSQERLTFRNGSMVDLYKLVFQLKYGKAEFSLPNRVYLDLERNQKELIDTALFCYELFVRGGEISREQLIDIAFDDVRRYFSLTQGVEASIQKREVSCLVLHKAGKLSFADDAGNAPNDAGDDLYTVLANALMDNPHPLVSEVDGYNGKAIQLTGDLTDLNNLNNQLEKSGLSLSLERRKVEMLVLTDNR